MAELTADETTADSCCASEAQGTCCEPSAKAECCEPSHGEGCGCAAGQRADSPDIRERVRERYAAAAVQVTSADQGAGCCAPSETFDGGSEVFGATLYALGDHDQLPDTAKLASLGCGNPIAVADLHEGETVLDLGSGGGIDVLLSASRVGSTGLAHGLDMTDEMLALARENARKAGVENVHFHKGYIEGIPLPDASVDVVISNCVINLSGDKPKVLREVARVLRPGGRFAVSDVIADDDMDEVTRADMQAYTGCIAGRSPNGSSSKRSQTPGSPRLTSARRTASTRTRPLRSCALASRGSSRAMRPARLELRPLAPEAACERAAEGRKPHWSAGLRHESGWRAFRRMPPICGRFGAIVAGLPLNGSSSGSPDSFGDAVFDYYDTDIDVAWVHAGRTVRGFIDQRDGESWSA
jgi:arsenite methyltransferase